MLKILRSFAMTDKQDATIAQGDEPLVIVRYDEEVAIMTLNQPRAINALSQDMLVALQAHLDEIAENKAVSQRPDW